MERGLTKNQIISELTRSPHGKLTEYLATGQKMAMEEPEFMAHLIAWDKIKGQIRDAKVALPVVSLTVPNFPEELAENSFAHLALLGPRELLRSYRFALEIRNGTALPRRKMRTLVERYLRNKESNKRKWMRLAVQHRNTLRELYALTHVKPMEEGNVILFGRNWDGTKAAMPTGSVFETIANLKYMSPVEAAGAIIENKIPFLIAMGALGKKAQEPDLVLALINRMSPTELVTNTKMLERLGVKSNPALRGAYEQALERASKSKKNVLKTTRAAEAISDEGLKEKLRGLQERQIQALSGIEGNWLVLADKSGSMHSAIEVAKEVAATLAKMVKGKVWLVFFDSHPQSVDVTGMALDVIKNVTKYIRAGGSTSVGCGLLRCLELREEIDGIAIVSDGGENQAPRFPDVYKRYCQQFGKEIPVYMYHCDGDQNSLISDCQRNGIDVQLFELGRSIDYYSLPNLVATMRTNRYSLVDEIMSTKLLTLSDVFKNEDKEEEEVAC